MECMICFDTMTAWNTHKMAGCSHSICIECADKMQSSIDSDNADYETDDDISSGSDIDLSDIDFVDDRLLMVAEREHRIDVIDVRLLVDQGQEPIQVQVPVQVHVQVPSQEPDYTVPIDYTVKYSLDGYKITRLNYFDMEGIDNTLQCPYCRQHEPIRYDFDEIRFCVPLHTSEWNILEKKLYEDKLTFFTMNRNGFTFAFKLSKDRSFLRIMWTEINKYAFTTANKSNTHHYSDHKMTTKRVKDVRAYNRPKRYTKMVR